ncbi:MAG: alkaline phosphatase family protein [Actinobacteria bacterium]|nr:alkaline phosphatase family protein [Actinomycetota bacterium]MCA1721214.1 alkaline phosphatase family protein [Actinomycetota bacterium]
MASPELVLGPVLRYADDTTACVWVETSASAEVSVHGATSRTFEVEGHHFGYVVLDGLEPGTDEPYDVRLDGRLVWPAEDDYRPPPRLRTIAPDDELHLVFGSCRTDRPHTEPWTLTVDEHPDGVGVDALHALSTQVQSGDRELPDLLLMLGDQVYADEGLSPRVRERQVERRGDSSDPQEEVADFEEYTWLYRDSWSDPEVRWLLSTVPSAMIFDDHDVRDDWNTSAAWRAQMRDVPWWRERIVGAYMSYWIYQHIGNLRPDRLREQGVFDDVCREGGPALRRYAELADDEVDGGEVVRWSFGRELGVARLVVIDTRSGRVLDEQNRAMLSDDEWELVEGFLRGDVEHLVVASSLPLALERSLHDLERWNDAVCGGTWGRRFGSLGERVRQGVDLEHWAAFPSSFRRLTQRLGEVAAGRHGTPPSTVLVLSGDVHHSYVAPLRFPDLDLHSAVVQVVSSPLRNAVPRNVQRGFRFAASRTGTAVGRLLAWSAGLSEPALDWQLSAGPFVGNTLGDLRLRPGRALLSLHGAVRQGGRSVLREVHAEELASS